MVNAESKKTEGTEMVGRGKVRMKVKFGVRNNSRISRRPNMPMA